MCPEIMRCGHPGTRITNVGLRIYSIRSPLLYFSIRCVRVFDSYHVILIKAVATADLCAWRSSRDAPDSTLDLEADRGRPSCRKRAPRLGSDEVLPARLRRPVVAIGDFEGLLSLTIYLKTPSSYIFR